MRDLLARNLGFQAVSEVVNLTTGLVTSAVLSRHLGVEGFGGFNYLFAFLYFFLTLNDLGVNTIVLREVSKDPDRADRILGAMLSFRLALAVVLVSVGWAVVAVVGFPRDLRVSLTLILLILPLHALRLPTVAFQAFLRFDYATLADVGFRLTSLALVLVAVAVNGGLIGVTSALLGAEVAGAGFALALSGRLVSVRPRYEPAYCAEVLRSALPLGLAVLLVAVTNRVDFLMLERLSGLDQVGLYGAAYKVTSLLERLPHLMMGTLYPVMARYVVQDRARLRAVYRKAVLGLAGLAVPVVALTTWLGPELLALWFGSGYREAAPGLRVLVWSTACLYVALTGGHLLVAIGWERVSLAAWIVGTALNVVLNMRWIPARGFVGAAEATAVAFAFVLAVTVGAVEYWFRRRR